jgi:hypothetical protein
MQMLYNSDSFAVVAIEVPGAAQPEGEPSLRRGGFEIVDKFARKEIFIEGALAERFQQGVQAIAAQGPTTEEVMDEFIGGFTTLAQQPLVLH